MRWPVILTAMFAAALVFLQPKFAPSISELDKLAQGRKASELSKFLDVPNLKHDPFRVIQTNGAYDVGRFGWHALKLKGVNGADYVVFSTPLTSEDTGELVFLRAGDKLHYVPETETYGIRLIRHNFDLRFSVPNKTATLVDKLKIKPTDSVGSTFLFRMSPQYIVSAIHDEAGQEVKFIEAGGVVETVKPTKEDTYAIEYSAKVDLPNYAGSISDKEASLTNDYWYPMVARQPVPYDLTIHSPIDWIAVGQGELVEEKQVDGEHVSRYRMDLPCVYYSVTTGPFKKFTQEINGKWYSCWSSQLSQDQMQAQTQFYAPIIEFYRQFAPFPFTGYGAVDSLVYGGGALEAYSFTTWGHGSLPAEDAHEPSHTWWGGIINNTYLGSFWNESFAVFSEGLYHRGVPIGNTSERKVAFIRDGNGNDSYNQVPIAESGADVGGLGSSLGYGKGAQVLQMLEQLLGTEKMVASMKAWITKSKGTASDWADYESVVSKLNPEKDLKTFFDDWVRKPGYADLSVSDVRYDAGQVHFNLGFTEDSYRIPLEVMLQFPDGSRSFTTIDVKKAGPISVSSSSKPSIVSLDPHRRILRKVYGDETPVELNSLVRSYSKITDPGHPDYLQNYGGESSSNGSVEDPAGKFIVGNPKSLPLLAKLCAKVGFKVNGDNLTYDGTTIDLNHGSAIAVVDLENGKKCIIGLGKTRVGPDVGRARLALTDDLGRFLRGKTEPKTSGHFTYKL